MSRDLSFYTALQGANPGDPNVRRAVVEAKLDWSDAGCEEYMAKTVTAVNGASNSLRFAGLLFSGAAGLTSPVENACAVEARVQTYHDNYGPTYGRQVISARIEDAQRNADAAAISGALDETVDDAPAIP